MFDVLIALVLSLIVFVKWSQCFSNLDSQMYLDLMIDCTSFSFSCFIA